LHYRFSIPYQQEHKQAPENFVEQSGSIIIKPLVSETAIELKKKAHRHNDEQ
jgi:hypothetical protein